MTKVLKNRTRVLLLVLFVAVVIFWLLDRAEAIIGPGSGAGVGGGVIQVDSNYNVSFGTSKVTIGNSTTSGSHIFRVISPTSTSFLQVDSYGRISVATSSAPPGSTPGGTGAPVKLFVDGGIMAKTLYINDISGGSFGTVNANQVLPGVFNCPSAPCQSTGLFSFPDSLRINSTSTLASSFPVSIRAKVVDNDDPLMDLYDSNGVSRWGINLDATGDATKPFNLYEAGGLSRFYVENTTGEVGISTVYPGYKLDVNGTFRASSTAILASGGANVGIGTVSPQKKLDVQANSDTYPIRFRYSSGEGTYGELVSGTNGIGLAARNVASGFGLSFYVSTSTSDIEVMKLAAGGDISIGLTSGNVGIGLSTGNVGIGLITNLYSKLNVEGNLTVGSGYAGTWSGPVDGIRVEGGVIIGTDQGHNSNRLTVVGPSVFGNGYRNTLGPNGGMIVEGLAGFGTTAPQSQLHVVGYAQFQQSNAGPPPAADCDHAPGSETGRIALDHTNNRLYICTALRGWDYLPLTN